MTWKSVDEKPPYGKDGDSIRVICFDENSKQIQTGRYFDPSNVWYNDEENAIHVTHWMPLPSLPEVI